MSWDQFDGFTESYEASCKHQRKQRSVARKKIKSKFLISAVRTLRNLRKGLRKTVTVRSDVPAKTRGDWPIISESSKKRTPENKQKGRPRDRSVKPERDLPEW